MSSLFSSPTPPPTPAAVATPTPPPTMPDPLSPELLAQRQKTMTDASARAGRTSTVLTTAASRAASTVAGGAAGTYGGAKLGSGA